MIKNIGLCLLSLLLLCLPWLGAPGYPVLVAFVPLLALQRRLADRRQATGRRQPLIAYVLPTFVLWTIITEMWDKNAAWIGVIAAVVANTFIYTLCFMVYHAVWRRAPRALAYTLLVTGWVAYELIYLNGQISFPWLLLGNGFAHTTRVVQWYEYTGVLGGSVWVWIANLTVYEAILRWRAQQKIRAFALPLAVIVLPILLSLARYATYTENTERIRVTAVQPNIDPYNEKFDPAARQRQRQILFGLAGQAPADVDYIITPETALDEDFWENDLEANPLIPLARDFMKTRYSGAELILGASTYYRYGPDQTPPFTARLYRDQGWWYDYYNTAFQIDSSAVIGVHHKSKPLIGVEMMPYGKYLKGLGRFSLDMGGLVGQIGLDPERTVFTSVKGVRAGVAICWEAVYGEYFTEYFRNGAQTVFIITNEGWWGDTQGYRQLTAYSRLRAIETRSGIARSANTGISCLIDPRGDIVSSLDWDKRGVVTGEVALAKPRPTFYVRWGDYVGRICGLVAVLCLLYFIAWRIRKRDHLTP